MRQDKNTQTPRRQAIERSIIYPRDVVEEILKLNKNTLGTWIKAGLRVVNAPDSKQMFFWSDIVEFLDQFRGGQ